MAHLDLATKLGGEGEAEVRARIVEGIAGEKSDQAALGVHAIERTLRAVKDIHALHVVGMEIERALAQNRHAIDIDAHGGRIDARSDATDVHCRGDAAAILGHGERGDVGRKLAETLHIDIGKLGGRELRAAQRLATQAVGLLRLLDDDYLVNIIDLRRIGRDTARLLVVLRSCSDGKSQGKQGERTKDRFLHIADNILYINVNGTAKVGKIGEILATVLSKSLSIMIGANQPAASSFGEERINPLPHRSRGKSHPTTSSIGANEGRKWRKTAYFQNYQKKVLQKFGHVKY